MNPRRLSLPLTLALALSPAAFAGELAGVKLPDTKTVAGKTLKLNGMGLRKKAVFKVYVGGLYLEAPSKDPNAVVAADAPKSIEMHFLRSVGRDSLVDAFKEGFEANAGQKAVNQKAAIEKMYGMVADVKDGSKLTFTYAPGAGTTVGRDGKDVGTIEGKEFADALFLLWMGPKPPSEDLKKGLLGS